MTSFQSFNPVVTAIYFLFVTAIAMFSSNPIYVIISLIGAAIAYQLQVSEKKKRTQLYFWVLFIILSLINPLVSHNGITVLFVMNDNPVTLEALIYGISASAAIIAVLYWFGIFSEIMTSDRLLYVLGGLSPKLSLIISMALRYVPLFSKQAEKINHSQKALGLYKEDNIIDALKGKIRVFSVMVTWTLENGIITADSMSARGYGIGKRTCYSDYKFRKCDFILLIFCCLMFAVSLWTIISGDTEFVFYPYIKSQISIKACAGYISYAVLVMLPIIIEAEEKLKWKYLISKI